MWLVDMHCHIDAYDDSVSVVAEAEANLVHTVGVTNLPSGFERMEPLLQGREYVYPALGLHPLHAFRRHFELKRVLNLLDRTRYIGEIGLDYSTPNSTDRQVQRHVFGRILEHCASAGNKILSVHSRRSAADVISAIGGEYPGKVILHWFAGSRNELERAVSYGYYFSVNPAMARTDRGISLIRAIPRERLLTETDGPFVKVDRKPVRPRDAHNAVLLLAGLLNLDVAELTGVVYRNFRQLHGHIPQKPELRGQTDDQEAR
jgi:TatD DNase family protein